MSDAREIHIHLTPQPGTTVHVTVAAEGVTVTSDNAVPDTAASSGDVLAAAIERLAASGASPHVRDAVKGLQALGYALRPAKTDVPGKIPENYLRIMDPRYTTHGIGYLTPTYFGFSRVSDREHLSTLVGAELLTTMVKFSHVESVEPGLNAARLVKS